VPKLALILTVYERYVKVLLNIMTSYKTEAISLGYKRFNEADKLVSFFTRDCGKVSTIAKSAFKSTSKFGGRLEIFSYNNIFLGKGKNLDILSQIETIDTFHLLRESEATLRSGMYMVNVASSFLEDRAKNTQLFELLLECFYMRKSGIKPYVATRIFDIKFADIEGFLPLEKLPSIVRGSIETIRRGDFEDNIFTKRDIAEIDMVMAPCFYEHIGKDINIWKRL